MFVDRQRRVRSWRRGAALLAVLLFLAPAAADAAVEKGSGGIRFTYDAPFASSVFLAGEFNGWNATANVAATTAVELAVLRWVDLEQILARNPAIGWRLLQSVEERLARERGAQVLRLIVEDWNEPARAQVEAMGLRPVSRWVMADRAVGDASPVPEGNGGRRTPAAERLRAVPSSEAEPSFMSWASGPLSHASRGLFPIGWSFRRMTVEETASALDTSASTIDRQWRAARAWLQREISLPP